ncbi:DUF2517 family protein [Shigella boydii]
MPCTQGAKVWNSTVYLHGHLLCRTYAVAAGVWRCLYAFLEILCPLYSYLHRVWSKTSDKPVWMD